MEAFRLSIVSRAVELILYRSVTGSYFNPNASSKRSHISGGSQRCGIVESMRAYVLWVRSRRVVRPCRECDVVIDSMNMLRGRESSGSKGYFIWFGRKREES